MIDNKRHHLTVGTGDNEWYTPSKYIEAARAAMGGIDLDPASNAHAQSWIRAGTYYTKDDDGLTKPWHGRVWLNPPYERGLIGLFVDKLLQEVASGRTTQAILLVNSDTDTRWYHDAVQSCSAVCYTRGRIPFEKDDSKKASPVRGSAFLYFGTNIRGFRQAFWRFGVVGHPPTPPFAEMHNEIKRRER
jgi:ParB family chromosome partitioning protein